MIAHGDLLTRGLAASRRLLRPTERNTFQPSCPAVFHSRLCPGCGATKRFVCRAHCVPVGWDPSSEARRALDTPLVPLFKNS